MPKDLTEIYDINAMNLAHLEVQLGVTSKEEMEYADDLMVAIAKVMCKFAQMEKDVSHFMRPKKAKTFMRTAKLMKRKKAAVSVYPDVQSEGRSKEVWPARKRCGAG